MPRKTKYCGKTQEVSLREALLSLKIKPFKPERWDALCCDTQPSEAG